MSSRSSDRSTADGDRWPLGAVPTVVRPLPRSMLALTLHRDRYGDPETVLAFEPG